MINPEDLEPDLDDMTRAQLHQLGMPGDVADILDDWLHRNHGLLSGRHYIGDFLEALAAEGYRVTKIEVPAFEELLPTAPEGGKRHLTTNRNTCPEATIAHRQ